MSASTPTFTPLIAPPVPELAPFIGNGRPPRLPRRRLGRYASETFALVLLVTLAAGALRVWSGMQPIRQVTMAPVVIYAPLRLEGAVVRGAPAVKSTAVKATAVKATAVKTSAMAPAAKASKPSPLRYGDPVEVALTAYCLRGLTRRDHYVRQGIVAADPRLFPLGRYVEIYVGRAYYGRFLVDDTGKAIKGNILDIWTPTCREARLFGRTKGTAVLVPRPRGASVDTLLTGRLGGAIP